VSVLGYLEGYISDCVNEINPRGTEEKKETTEKFVGIVAPGSRTRRENEGLLLTTSRRPCVDGK
jgi:hypothetical protein